MTLTYTKPINQTELYMQYVVKSLENTEILESNKIRYWLPSEYKETLVACLDEKGTIAGLIGMQQSPHRGQEDLLWVKFVSVREDMQKLGIASELIKRGFEHAETLQKSILNSSYSSMGAVYLKPVFTRVATQFPNISFYEQAECELRDSPFNIKYCARAVEARLEPM